MRLLHETAATAKIGLMPRNIACHAEEGSLLALWSGIDGFEEHRARLSSACEAGCIQSHVVSDQMNANAPIRLPEMTKGAYLICPGYPGYDIYVTGH